MKTLHLALVVISLICLIHTLLPVEAQCYGCGQNSSALKQALLEKQSTMVSSPITVATNLQNYITGDKITISSHISNPDKNTPLVIKIFDPRNQMQFNKMFQPSENQTYSWTVSTVDFWGFLNSGNYTVLAQYGQDHATTYFNLNSTLTQYLYSQSPLWQFKNGMPARDVHCHEGLQLVIKAEDSTPACVEKLAATKLILWGWAMGPLPNEIYVDKISITGLQQSYAPGQLIKADVVYQGYYTYVEPEVRILDANGTQIWFNCPFCYTRTEVSQTPSVDTFTYHVREYSNNKLPVINKTGTYTMVATLENKTAVAVFKVTDLQNGTLTASFEPCDIPYPQNYTGIPVLYMQQNSTAKICVRYHNLNDFPVHVGVSVSEAGNLTESAKEITTWSDAENGTIGPGDSTIVYWIKTGNKGLYGLTIFCVPMPLAVGYDNATLTESDFPWLGQNMWYCPMEAYNFHIDSTTGFKVGYIQAK